MTEIDQADVARMMMYQSFGYDYDEIGQRVGCSESTVGKYLRRAEDQARAADDPESVFWDYMLAMVFDERFRAGLGAMLASSGTTDSGGTT